MCLCTVVCTARRRVCTPYTRIYVSNKCTHAKSRETFYRIYHHLAAPSDSLLFRLFFSRSRCTVCSSDAGAKPAKYCVCVCVHYGWSEWEKNHQR